MKRIEISEHYRLKRMIENIVTKVYYILAVMMSIAAFGYGYIPTGVQEVMTIIVVLLFLGVFVLNFLRLRSKNKDEQDSFLDKYVSNSPNYLLRICYDVHNTLSFIFFCYISLLFVLSMMGMRLAVVALLIYILLLGVYLGSLFYRLAKSYLNRHVEPNLMNNTRNRTIRRRLNK